MPKIILMIDDDKHLLEIYKNRFEEDKFQVFTALNAAAGLKIAKKERPNIIILDINMPKKNGLELLEDLKRDEVLASTPVIILSTASSRDIIDKAMALGAIDYLVKSHITPGDLSRKLKELL